jgi:hypothetical protein
MRAWIAGLVVFGLAGALAAGGTPAKPEDSKPEKSSVPPKPKVRRVQLKSGFVLFDVRIEPGVPDPREVVEIRLEVAEVPPVPDPIYGERIPVKGAEFVAEVTDADGAGYTLVYRVHALGDAGSYGFHFTPLRRDNFVIKLKGSYKGKRFGPDFRVPVGIWPFTRVDDKGKVSTVEAKSAGSRMPAVPSGMKAPVVPGGVAPVRESPGRQRTALQESMENLGELWAWSGVALLTGRKPNLGEAKRLAGQLQKAVEEASKLRPSDSEFTGLMQELHKAVGSFASAAGSGKAAATKKAFESVGSHHCNRCHFKMRWNLLDNLVGFPAELP